jgi:nucleotide-binding universal stress UspA family protein
MLEQIIVPQDGSIRARIALGPAVDIARRDGARLLLLQARVSRHEQDRVRQALESLANVHPGLTFEVQVVEGDAAPAIAATCTAEPASLICMSTHGRSGLSRALLGSVAEDVLRTVRVPVLLVGPRCPESVPPLTGPVFACADGSAVSEQILPLALGWARWLEATCCFVHAVDPDTPLPERHTTEASYLRTLVDDLTLPHDSVQTKVLRGSSPTRAIAALVASEPGGLLVLSTHGHSGLSRLVMGSVAMSLVREARNLVLVRRAEGLSAR